MIEEEAPRAEVKRADRLQGQKVVVVLEDAVLELAKGREGSLQLLEGLQHRRLLQHEERDTTDVRPDIAHQCLMALQESPLNRVGEHVFSPIPCVCRPLPSLSTSSKAVVLLISTDLAVVDRQLIEVHPQLRVPPTYEEFRKLMVNLLHTRRIRAVEKNVTLLQIIKNDPNLFLPVSCRKIAKGHPVDLEAFVQQFKETKHPVVFLVGAVAHTNPTANSELAEECVSIAPCGLSAGVSETISEEKGKALSCFSFCIFVLSVHFGVCCSSICAEFENLWDIH
ncbi:nucleolar essential protein [Cyclospora cayetanensis]|uniref:Nucleolar essential protein n=1 Tax=Cyclospora cayetanensis TaxID=88456 RepID=A0A1D3CWR2_9EIME|nr:nucleolar essential protein [Cyclospora cayetanensis]